MSAQQNTNQKSAPALLILMGALAFTLSPLPGTKLADTQSLSSSGCDLDGQLQSGNHGECLVKRTEKGRVIKAKVEVNLVNRREVSRDPKDATKFKETTVQKWVVSVSDIEAEGKAGCVDCILKGDSAHKDLEFEDMKKVGSVAEQLFTTQADDLAKAAAEAAIVVAKQEKCTLDEDGLPLTTSKEILKCKIGKLSGMDSEKAAEYYDENIQPDIEALAISPNAADQRAAALLMGPRSELARSRNPYIKQSLQSLQQFGQYATAARGLQFAANDLTASSQDRQNARAQLGQLQRTWGGYFAAQGRQVANMQGPQGWNAFDYGGNLYDDIAGQGGYNQTLNSRFASIADQHNQLINGTNVDGTNPATPVGANVNNTAAGSSGRTLHGTPTTTLNTQVNGANTYAQQPRVGTQAQPYPGATANRSTIPAYGSPVNVPRR